MAALSAKQRQISESLGAAKVVAKDQAVSLASGTATEDLKAELQKATLRIKELEALLSQKNTECTRLQSDLTKLGQKLTELQDSSAKLKEKQYETHKQLRAERQIAKRAKEKSDKLAQQIHILNTATAEASKHEKESSKKSHDILLSLKQENKKLYNSFTKSLRKKAAYSRETKELLMAKAKAKAEKQWTHNLMNKGVYTEKTRSISHLLVKAGCSRNYVNVVIQTILESAGIKTIGTMSPTSVGRFIREGHFSSQVQLGHELRNAETVTLSGDGTSHKAINYNSRHVHFKAKNYETGKLEQTTRTLGIRSSRDGTSEESVRDWNDILTNISEVYNNSPLAKRAGSIIKLVDIMIKVTGMNSDHCSTEKKTARLLKEQKEFAVNQHLGEEKMLDMTILEVQQYFEVEEEKMIKKMGGRSEWNKLSDVKKAERKARMIEEAIATLGKEEFEKLSDTEKQVFRLFIWAGCGCHKDLNTVKGGYIAMLGWWIDNAIADELLVLLANSDNDPVVGEHAVAIEQGDTPTPAQERAFHKSQRGAIKTLDLAGAICKHKDKKKGHQDGFRYWWKDHVGVDFAFPDTSNNRFQSYCYAAAAIVLHTDNFKNYMQFVKDTKHNSKFNHMEENFWKALHCNSTLTELAVLALYAESVSYPYMKYIRTSAKNKENMLDLGPFHMKVYNHMQSIIEDPHLLIGNNAADNTDLYKTATLNGEKWENSEVVEKILALIPTLPHFQELLLAFFEGAAETWERFTSEFLPGGLIDEAGSADKDLAWLPSVNDENEGSLGKFRSVLLYQPLLTLLDHNALQSYFRNNTESFIKENFTEEEDYKYIHKLACETGGQERQRKREIIEFRNEQQAKKAARRKDLVLDIASAKNLKGKRLNDHYDFFHKQGAPNMINQHRVTKADEKRDAVAQAIEHYLNGEWNLGVDDTQEDEEDKEELDNSPDLCPDDLDSEGDDDECEYC
ncbi:hypothetical protein HYPSUDRAFT_69639 [Hypholoma sublateritium FD-334 SS-4]|uniref:Uncharacterized protein n=1 Tax=Hypholoma sublateritium (strain FD-334 SS-4) TaxID=945553 RepID=A0A0D2NQ19_HYPSF|nr:hypothetical protein HYPSUDRAFT_69639 [Hypholoma sublateritium FD-334 SS-4]